MLMEVFLGAKVMDSDGRRKMALRINMAKMPGSSRCEMNHKAGG
jgi:hypothetical protein